MRLLQERDNELQQNDVTIAQLRGQLSQQLEQVSQLGIKLQEASENGAKLEQALSDNEKRFHKQIQSDQADFDKRFSEKLSEYNAERLEWNCQKRALEENCKVTVL